MIKAHLEAAKHDATDVTRRFILTSTVSVSVSIAILALVVLWLFPGASADQRMRTPLPSYPQPRIQLNPEQDLQTFDRDEASRLAGNGAAQIPIEQAMRQTAEQKIANWPGAPIAAPESTAQPSASESSHVAVRKTPGQSHLASGNRSHRIVGARVGRHRVSRKPRR